VDVAIVFDIPEGGYNQTSDDSDTGHDQVKVVPE
jgi:hypothetical protein